MAHVVIKMTPWKGDHEAEQTEDATNLLVRSITVNGRLVEPGGVEIHLEGRTGRPIDDFLTINLFELLDDDFAWLTQNVDDYTLSSTQNVTGVIVSALEIEID